MRRALWVLIAVSAVGIGLSGVPHWLTNGRSTLIATLAQSGIYAVVLGGTLAWCAFVGKRTAKELERRGFACCTRCEHDLRGVAVGAVCPECEMPIVGDRRQIWKLFVPRIRIDPPASPEAPSSTTFPRLPHGVPADLEPVRELSRLRWMALPIVLPAFFLFPVGFVLIVAASRRSPTAIVMLIVIGMAVAAGIWTLCKIGERSDRIRELVIMADFAFCPECGTCQAGLPREAHCNRCFTITYDRFRVKRWNQVLGIRGA